MLMTLTPVVKLLLVLVKVITKGLMEYVQGNLLVLRIQLRGRPRELVAGLIYVGIVRIILDPLMTVELSTGSKEMRSGPKYPAVSDLSEVVNSGRLKSLRTTKFSLERGVVANATSTA